jgi:hypothetical protein
MRPCAVVIGVAAGLLVACTSARAATIVPDDARETRWADEVVPQLVVGEAVWLATPQRARVLALYSEPSGKARGAVIVVHGTGVHPDWSLIGELRSALPDHGLATLSVQMPVLAADAPGSDYDPLFPIAAQRLDAGVAWLKARGHAHIAVVSHSLGASMVNAWLASAGEHGVDAWIPIGMLVEFATPPRLPVLDVTAERDYSETLKSRRSRAAKMARDKCSRSVVLANTDHVLDHAVQRAVDRIVPFLEQVFAGDC